MTSHVVRIATRGSALALWQAEYTRRRLQAAEPAVGAEPGPLPVDLVVLKTQGDRIVDRPLSAIGGKGLFTKEIEEALLDGRADVAVHSMKDLPADSDLPRGLIVAAVPERADPADALVLPASHPAVGVGISAADLLRSLPPGARVGTSSVRRVSQLLALRPDLQIVPLRGNVDTRLRKLDGLHPVAPGGDAAGATDAGPLHAAVLAAAGLLRLGLGARISARFTAAELIPACGQGALALQCRGDDDATRGRLARLADLRAGFAVAAERAFGQHLSGSCHTALGAHAAFVGDSDGLHMVGFVGARDGSRLLRATIDTRVADVTDAAAAGALGRRLADDLIAQGAAALLSADPA